MERRIPKKKQQKASPPRITDVMLANALRRYSGPPLEILVPQERVFAPARPAPGVVPEKIAKDVTMAMDEFPCAWGAEQLVSAWGGAGYGGGVGWDGFIGYPELSLLAQKPEYRRISEVIALECVRKWIRLKSTSESKKSKKKIEQLDGAQKHFRLQWHVGKLIEKDGFFGRGHLYIDTGATDNPKELLTSIGDGRDKTSLGKVKKGQLVKFKVVEPIWTYPTQYNSSDPLSAFWYFPEHWFVMGKQIHSTRLLTMIAREVPDILKPAYSFGGLSLTQMSIPYVNNWLKTRASVNAIISSFSQFVLKTNLATSLSADGDQLFARAQIFNLIRDNRNLMMVDKDTEDFMNVSAPLGSLDHLQAQAEEHMCLPAGIPIIKFFGDQPSGLNASSEGVIRTFYDNINAYQERVLRPPIQTALDFIMLNEWGEVDEDISFDFNPLWALDEKSESEKKKTEADTDVVYVEAGVISQEEVREKLVSDPDSHYANLDPDDVPELPENVEGKPVNARKMLGAGEDPEDEKPLNAKPAKPPKGKKPK